MSVIAILMTRFPGTREGSAIAINSIGPFAASVAASSATAEISRGIGEDAGAAASAPGWDLTVEGLNGETAAPGCPPAPAGAPDAGACVAGGPANADPPVVGGTTRGPGRSDARPRPKARRFSIFSLSLSLSPATFPAAAVVIGRCPQEFLNAQFPALIIPNPSRHNGHSERREEPALACRIRARARTYIDSHQSNISMPINILS